MYSSDSDQTTTNPTGSWGSRQIDGEATLNETGEDLALHKSAYLGEVHQLRQLLHKFDVNIRG